MGGKGNRREIVGALSLLTGVVFGVLLVVIGGLVLPASAILALVVMAPHDPWYAGSITAVAGILSIVVIYRMKR